MLVFILIILTATFAYALLEEWRYRNRKRDIARDLKGEFYVNNRIKRRR